MIHRAYDLNIIDAVKYRNAYIYLRKSGQSKVERGDAFVKVETSSLLENMTNHLVANDIEDLASFIRNKGWSADLFAKVMSFKVDKVKEYMEKQNNVISFENYKLG